MNVYLQTLELRSSPHFKKGAEVDDIMRNVVYALLPIALFSVYLFGVSALALLLVTTLTCVLTEHLFCKWAGKASTVGDWSVTITGLLLALTLPPGLPLWMAVVGGVIAVALGKMLFGGLGFNMFNPALVGRAFLQISFPVAITTWSPAFVPGRFTQFIPSTLTLPFMKPLAINDWIANAAVDGFSGATPLALSKFDGIRTGLGDLFLGQTAGSVGETSTLLIALCAAYLIARKMMDWRIPASMLGMAFITSAAFYFADTQAYPSPFFMLFSGGLMLGACFMASDMVASPVTPLGVWFYGGLMGFLTIIIRLKGGLPEGVMFAILLGNAVSPLISSLTQPRIYGAHKKVKKL